MNVYAQSGGDAFAQIVDQHMQLIAQFVEKHFPHQYIKALILGGGYGRGEGGVRDVDGAPAPYNDYDLVLVHECPDQGLIHRVCAQGHQDLSQACGIHVDITPLHQSRLKNLPPALTWFELAQGHHVVLGDEDVLAPLQARRITDVDATEWGRLLVNRGSGVHFAAWAWENPDQPLTAKLLDGEPWQSYAQRQVSKAWLAVGDVFLAEHGDYVPTVVDRWQAMQTKHAGFPYLAAYQAAVDFKMHPDSGQASEEDLRQDLQLLGQVLQPLLVNRSASQWKPLAAAVGNWRLRHAAPFLGSWPWVYPRERMRRALLAFWSGDQARYRHLVGSLDGYFHLWNRYG